MVKSRRVIGPGIRNKYKISFPKLLGTNHLGEAD
jgi:hypothetical protein